MNIYTNKYFNLLIKKAFDQKDYNDYGKEILNNKSLWDELENKIISMNEITKENNAKFIIMPLIDSRFLNESKLIEFNRLNNIAKKNNIDIINISDISIIFENPELFLENDGHFNQNGTKKIANIIADYIKDQYIKLDLLE